MVRKEPWFQRVAAYYYRTDCRANSHHLDRQKVVKKLEGKDKASLDIPFMIQSHAENIKKIVGAL